MTELTNPRVTVAEYRVVPACFDDDLAGTDRDRFAVRVVAREGRWMVRNSVRDFLTGAGTWVSSPSDLPDEEWLFDVDEAVTLALRHVDAVRVNGLTLAGHIARRRAARC